jgi:hypothetical protein
LVPDLRWVLAGPSPGPYAPPMTFKIEYLNAGGLRSFEEHPGPIKAACDHAGKNLGARDADSARIISHASLAERRLVKSDGRGGYVTEPI